MRILITTNKAVSHFRPLLPFAHGLKARGHKVRIAALADLSEEITGQGFDHLQLEGPTQEARADLNERAGRLPRAQTGKFAMSQLFMGILPRASLPGLLTALHDWRPDLILRETTEFSGLIAAEKIGVPHVRLEIVNGESEESIATNYVDEMDALRALVGLASVGAGYLRTESSFSAHPQVLDDTPRVNSQAPFRFTAATPPPANNPTRPDWLPSNSRPLIYMTFGTIAAGSSRSNHVYRIGLEAIADLPVNVLLTTGTDVPSDLLGEVPPNALVRPFVPQAEVLPHAQLLVCHGGSGTVLGGLAAGVPMVVVPLFADQPDNARCLASAGLGHCVSDVDSATLRSAISTALEDDELRKRASAAAREFAAMPTVEQALDRLASG